jgi:hypothetical protein
VSVCACASSVGDTWEAALHLGCRHTLCRSSLTCGEPLGAPLTQCGPAALCRQSTGRSNGRLAGSRSISDIVTGVNVGAWVAGVWEALHACVSVLGAISHVCPLCVCG